MKLTYKILNDNKDLLLILISNHIKENAIGWRAALYDTVKIYNIIEKPHCFDITRWMKMVGFTILCFQPHHQHG